MSISEYNREQSDALEMIREYFRGLNETEVQDLHIRVAPYLGFRKAVSGFQDRHLAEICTAKCFSSNESACCNRNGIATFFADWVINCLMSSPSDLDRIENALTTDPGGFKCVYLTGEGCLWRIKPIVCEMFLCDHAKDALKISGDSLQDEWDRLRKEEKAFTWPDRPVLFDEIEDMFLQAGYESPLMYLHKSPGLLRVKARAQERLS